MQMVKRYICLFLSVIILISSSGCSKKGISKVSIVPIKQKEQDIDLQWNNTSIKPAIKQYSVKEDLSNISNEQDVSDLDPFDRYMLSRNLFIIKQPSEIYEQPFSIYEKNSEEGVPNFITVDSIIHAYHIAYDYVIKNMEKERLIDELKAFTSGALKQSITIYNGISEKNVKKAALKNIAYFGVAMKLMEMDLPGGIPLEANRMIDNDIKRIRVRWGSGTSEIFPYYIDYKKYTTKGHYSRETDYRNYFLTMTWYGNTPLLFDLYDTANEVYKRMDEQIIMAVIMSAGILNDESLRTMWQDLYNISSTYFGRCSDATVYDLSDIIKVIYGETINFNKLWDAAKIQKVYELAKQRYNLHSWETIGGRLSLSNNEMKQQVQFRLMVQAYNIDSDIFSSLIGSSEDGERLIPKGLDVAAAFGSDEALYILKEQVDQDNEWDGYADNLQKLREVMSGVSGDDPRDYSLNNMIFWALKPYLNQYGSSYPSFMLDDYWKAKKLITYLGAASDVRHLSSFSSKGGEIKDNERIVACDLTIPGFVEPDVELYSRLEYAGRVLGEFVSVNKIRDTRIHNLINNFINLVSFLKEVSIKELEGTELTADEEARIKEYGSELKNLIMGAVESKADIIQWDTIPQVDKNMAGVVDAYQHENKVLQTAVGFPDYIYAVIPYKEKLYIARGSAYSYYEFVEPVSRKLDDKEWQSRLKNGNLLEQPIWIKKIRY